MGKNNRKYNILYSFIHICIYSDDGKKQEQRNMKYIDYVCINNIVFN